MRTAPASVRLLALRRGACAVLALASVGVLAPSRGAAADDLLEPRPPWIFFPEPDPASAAEIDELVTNYFGDQGKAVVARDRLVRRYGLVSVPRLVREISADNNVTQTWNALLAIYPLRDRVGPARELWPVLEPTVAILKRGGEAYRRVFAALAIGSFHGRDTIPVGGGAESVVLVRDRAGDARRAHFEAGLRLAAIVRDEDGNRDVRAAAALALAKRGQADSEGARDALLTESLWTDQPGIEVRQAVLCAIGLLPGPGDEDRLLKALKHEQSNVRRAAALAITLQAVGDPKPRWLSSAAGGSRVADLLRALETDVRPALEDGAEAVFTRGVLALRGDPESPSAPGQWTAMFEIAVGATSEKEAAIAAAQALLFCPESWLTDRVVGALESGVTLPDPVAAAFLRIAAFSGTARGLEVARDYFRTPSKSPRGDERWDARFHAAFGVLEAFTAGRMRDPDLRARAVEALDIAVKRGLAPAAPFRARLERVLDLRRAQLLADPTARVPLEDLRALEGTFTCPDGLLAHEVEDLAIHRLNVLVPILFRIHPKRSTPGEPDKTDQPQRFLKACLDRYPYFRRLELRANRGLRPVETMVGDQDDPAREVRPPR